MELLLFYLFLQMCTVPEMFFICIFQCCNLNFSASAEMTASRSVWTPSWSAFSLIATIYGRLAKTLGVILKRILRKCSTITNKGTAFTVAAIFMVRWSWLVVHSAPFVLAPQCNNRCSSMILFNSHYLDLIHVFGVSWTLNSMK